MAKTDKNNNETYFEWWLDDLKKFGIVHSYFREPETFLITEPIPIFYNQHYKQKKDFITKSFTLFNPISYTPDYLVYFNLKSLNKFIGIIDGKETLRDFENIIPGSVYDWNFLYTTETEIINGELYLKVYFDVKPHYKSNFSGTNSSNVSFPLKQYLIYKNQNIYVNKIIPTGSTKTLFAKTFVPSRYYFTDGGTKNRKINHSIVACEKWLTSKQIPFKIK